MYSFADLKNLHFRSYGILFKKAIRCQVTSFIIDSWLCFLQLNIERESQYVLIWLISGS